MRPGVKMESVMPHFDAEISRITKEKVSEEELQKAKNQIMHHWVEGMKKVPRQSLQSRVERNRDRQLHQSVR